MSGVIWITGLSAAGKTTLGNIVKDKIIEKHLSCIMLDGDVLRDCLDVKGLNTKEDRKKLAYTYSRFAKMLASQGVNVVVGTNALFKEIHVWNRENIDNYFEVFLDVPMEELRRRDPKGIYKRFYNGEITDVAGLDIEVDFPKNPDYLVKYNPEQSPDNTASLVIENFLVHHYE